MLRTIKKVEYTETEIRITLDKEKPFERKSLSYYASRGEGCTLQRVGDEIFFLDTV